MPKDAPNSVFHLPLHLWAVIMTGSSSLLCARAVRSSVWSMWLSWIHDDSITIRYNREWQYHQDLKLWYLKVRNANLSEALHSRFKRGSAADGLSVSNNQYIYFDISSWECRLFSSPHAGSMRQCQFLIIIFHSGCALKIAIFPCRQYFCWIIAWRWCTR